MHGRENLGGSRELVFWHMHLELRHSGGCCTRCEDLPHRHQNDLVIARGHVFGVTAI